MVGTGIKVGLQTWSNLRAIWIAIVSIKKLGREITVLLRDVKKGMICTFSLGRSKGQGRKARMREQRFEVVCVAATEYPYLRGKPEEDRHVTGENKGHIKTLIQGSKKGL